MAITKLSASGVVNFVKYRSMLAGNPPYEPPAPSAYDLLETEILPSSQASVTFSSLNSTYGADYQHLQIRYVARASRSGLDSVAFRFNGDSATNYSRHGLYGDGLSVGSYGQTNTSFTDPGFAPGDSAPAGAFGVGVVDILDPFETTKYTTVRGLTGLAGGQNWVGLNSGNWRNTAALTSIQIFCFNSANILALSRFSLYGLKAA